MSCEDTQRQLTAYLDGELEGERGSVVRGHLRECAACRAIAGDESALRDGLRMMPPVDPPHSLWAGVQAQLAAAEVADARRPAWRRALARWSAAAPSVQRFAATGLVAAAAITVLWWRSHRAVEETQVAAPEVATVQPVGSARAIAPVVVPPGASPGASPSVSPLPNAPAGDVTVELVSDGSRLSASYRDAAEELTSLAGEARGQWSADRQRAFDARVIELHGLVDRAPEGRLRQRAWRDLIKYLQGAVVRDDVALAGGWPMKAAWCALGVVAGFGGVVAADPAAPVPLVEHSRLEIAPGGHAIKQLVIENPLGDVKIEGYDGTSILIETRKQAPDEDALDRLRVSLIPNPDGTVRIMTTADGGKEFRSLARSAVHIDLTIRAPRDARIDAAVIAGALEVKNMDAGGELDTASGPISVRNVAGEVSTHSVSGMTTLAQVFGSVDAQTVSSDLDLDTIGGERLIASANRGKIAGRRVRARDVELTTTDGKIVLEAEASLRGHVMVASLRGDIDVKLRRHGVVVVRAHGAKLNLGTAMVAAKTSADGWVEGRLGGFATSSENALVELRSRFGTVQFAVIE